MPTPTSPVQRTVAFTRRVVYRPGALTRRVVDGPVALPRAAFAAAAIAIGLFGLSGGAAHAFPKFAKAESKPCGYCHVNPAGGGERNYRGLFYKTNGLSFAGFDDAAEAKKAGVEVGPVTDPSPTSGAAPTEKALPPAPPVDPASIADLGEATFDNIPFVRIPAGTFRRGTTDAQRAALRAAGQWKPMQAVELPAREIRITKPFFLGKFEVTQAQWRRVMDDKAVDAGGKGRRKKQDVNPSSFKNPNQPVETVSWNEAQTFLNKMNEAAGGNARYRLPTEAEWEYACRAGSQDVFGMGPNKTPITAQTLPEYGWFSVNANNNPRVVGKQKANAWGLYDMHGNVWEWCQDGYSPTFYADSLATDPVYTGPSTERIFRGGCWFLDARALRAAVRGGNLPDFKSPYVGFRVVREL